MPASPSPAWDYLIVTASNDRQASAYSTQLQLRRDAGQLAAVRETMVVADLDGKRIGSGASTLDCLLRVVNRERASGESPEATLRRLRILIIHAGGDSRRLPAYGPAGKIFVPLPGDATGPVTHTLFDLLAPAFMELPSGAPGAGQTIVASGDALNEFDASAIRLDAPGMTILGCPAPTEEASRHGVFCVSSNGAIRLYLQKPSPAVQRQFGAIDERGQATLDIGVMSLDGNAGAALLEAFGVVDRDGVLAWSDAMRDVILTQGIDLYREVCCAVGSEATLGHYIASARASGSTWSDDLFAAAFGPMSRIPAPVQGVPSCRFLHFGSTRQLIASGHALVGADPSVLSVNNQLSNGGALTGANAWVEGCRIAAPLTLAGENVVIGVDINQALALPEQACLETLAGASRSGDPVWFVRCYGIRDTFKDSATKGGTFCGVPILEWLSTLGAAPEHVWDSTDRSLWNARVFPAETEPTSHRDWLWMYRPASATASQKSAWLTADRYSAAEIALLADQDAFHQRRAEIHAHKL